MLLGRGIGRGTCVVHTVPGLQHSACCCACQLRGLRFTRTNVGTSGGHNACGIPTRIDRILFQVRAHAGKRGLFQRPLDEDEPLACTGSVGRNAEEASAASEVVAHSACARLIVLTRSVTPGRHHVHTQKCALGPVFIRVLDIGGRSRSDESEGDHNRHHYKETSWFLRHRH